MDLKTVQAVFSKENEGGLFGTDGTENKGWFKGRKVLDSYEDELKKLWDSLYPSEKEKGSGETIEVGVFIELMENLGHDYVIEEVQVWQDRIVT